MFSVAFSEPVGVRGLSFKVEAAGDVEGASVPLADAPGVAALTDDSAALYLVSQQVSVLLTRTSVASNRGA